MITFKNSIFKIDTKNTSYIFSISKFNHLLHQYYGERIDDNDLSFILFKNPTPYGTSVNYDDDQDENYSLDIFLLEFSYFGKGDYRNPSLIFKNKDGYLFDFKYVDFEITNNSINLKTMPSVHGDNLTSLSIKCEDMQKGIELILNYIVDYDNDVIIRNINIKNKSNNTLEILKASSLQLDLLNDDYQLLNLYGGWGFEGQVSISNIENLTYINDSKTGNSSNRHNPFFIVKNKKCDENYGKAYGFNLMYSGNHFELVEKTSFHQIRIQNGVNDFQFNFKLNKNDIFETPFAVMTFSSCGLNKLSQNFHNFILEHVLPLNYQDKMPPILINNWEATYFKFTYKKIKSIIRKASDFDLELFVLDDGWFSNRNDDYHGLGDYDVNKKKLPFGLKRLAKTASNKKLLFGIWVEPEMCNEDSKLYKLHPDWIIRSPLYKPSKGRHQFVLDLSKKDVVDYIIYSLDTLLKSAPIKYIKWDMNRNISDVDDCGEKYHRYIIGLYKIFSHIRTNFSDVYIEGCASGGNRFDLGMLSYCNSIWASDDTDSFERLTIQKGLALGYPLKVISNHVSQVPSHSVLRNTTLDNRFNVAMFGNLGYELDLSTLLPYEKKSISGQVEFYKKYRKTILNGQFYQYRNINDDGYTVMYVVSKDKTTAIVGIFNGLQKLNPKPFDFTIIGLDDNTLYNVKVKDYKNNITTFGGLINTLLPFHVNERGFLVQTIAKYKQLDGETFSYVVSGKALRSGALKLNQQWLGTGYNNEVSVYGDFNSHVFIIEKVDKNEN